MGNTLDGVTFGGDSAGPRKYPVVLEIVGHCPSCGAPIYGHKTATEGQAIQVRYSCLCWRKEGLLGMPQVGVK